MRQPVGDRLYFAGEATAKDWGTVAGANDSGIETAKNLDDKLMKLIIKIILLFFIITHIIKCNKFL